MSVRPAEPADLTGIVALEQGFPPKERWSPDAWRGELEADNRDVLVAGDPVEGVITVQHVGGVADLNRIVVAPRRRRAGLGRRLVEAGIERATSHECDEMLLEVRSDNAPALALYEQQGFAPIARRRDYYGPGADAVIMRVDLTCELDPTREEDDDE